jgi:glycosyltransferase involved in cell wall biosynthesis
VSARELLFYGSPPLGFHNIEAERKALAFADAGYDVVVLPGVGIRNPRPSSLRKLAGLVGERVRSRGQPQAAPERTNVRTATLAVLPPRQFRAMHDLNERWLERQLRGVIHDWPRAVVWLRWPTQELVDALRRLKPAVVVYEVSDALHRSPGMVGPWPAIFAAAERTLVARADAVVAPSEALAERYGALGGNVRLLPHGVDLFPWPGPEAASAHSGGPTTIGYVGTLDHRLDMDALRYIAQHMPDWRLRLIGPNDDFEGRRLAGFANVSIESPIPHAELGPMLVTFDVGIMPYYDQPLYGYAESSPLKNLELFAAGKPAVARTVRALEQYTGGLLYFAETPEDYVRQLRRAVAETTPELALERRRVAEANTWDRRLGEMLDMVGELLGAKA